MERGEGSVSWGGAAVVLSAGLGFLVLAGYLWGQGYLFAMGLPRNAIRYDVYHYALEGVAHAGAFLIMGLLLLGQLAVYRRFSRTAAEVPWSLALGGVVFGAALMGATLSYNGYSDDTPRLFDRLDVTWGQVGIFLLTFVAIGFTFQDGDHWRWLQRHIRTPGIAVLVVLVSYSGVGVATFNWGYQAAQEQIEGTGSRHEVDLTFIPGHSPANGTYLLVARHEGAYYVRDLDAGRTEDARYRIFPGDVVASALVRRVEP